MLTMPKHAERKLLNFLEEFKRTHPWLDVAPPRPKNQRNQRIYVRKDLHPIPELNEYVEPHPIKLEHVETQNATMPYDKLAARFEKMNGTKLGNMYQGEVGKGLGLPYTGEFELYSPESPIGQQFSGYMKNMNTGKIEEVHLFIMPKN